MSWVVIAALILLGFALIIVELIVIPGTTFVGILGVISVIVGIFYTYSEFGAVAGHYTLGGSVLTSALVTFWGYKTFASQRFSVKKVVEGKVNLRDEDIEVGHKGETVSNLRPAGKAMINGKRLEVTSLGEFLEANQEIEVIKISGNKIFVKPIKSKQDD